MGRKNVLGVLVILAGLLSYLLLYGEESYTELIFSDKSGFYEQSFELELYAPKGTEIYYTLDGSEPDENAIRYTEPIFIGYATENENVYSMRTDVSAGFLTKELTLYEYGNPGYVSPDYPIDKCTIVRAAYLDAEGSFSEVKTESFFVGYEGKIEYDGLNIISVVTEPANLFDYDTGIYVLGRTYDEYIDNVHQTEQGIPSPYWWWWGANYHQHGYAWERAANIQLFNTERKMILDQACGIRIQGGGSRGQCPRSMKIYAREQYDNNGRFYVNLFNTDYMADTITLFAGGDDSIAKIRDRIMAELVEQRDFATMHFVPCVMFLDGEYWGIYWLTEQYNDVFLGYYYNVDKDNVIMIKNGELAEGEELDYELYVEMMDYMADTDFSIQANYEHACQIIDMQSFIDYYASQIYIGRYNDWPVGNIALWRTREIKDGDYEDGKWRWMLFDVNSGGLSSGLIETDTIHDTRENSEIFNNLCQNEDFQKQFVTTFMDIANTCFNKERVDSIISEHINLLTQPMSTYMKRFFGTESTEGFTYGVADVQMFFDNRKPYIVKCLKDNFGLTGDTVPVEIEINDANAGSIVINSAKLTFENDMTWMGEYYTDYPIVLTAVPNEGYCLAGWESNDYIQEFGTGQFLSGKERIEIDLPECGIALKAIFEKINE